MNRSYKVIWNQSLNCFMAVAEYAKSRGKSSSHVVSSTSTASAAVSSGARLLRLSALSVGLITAGFSMQAVAGYEVAGGSTFTNCTRDSNGSGGEAASIAIANESSIACAPAIEAIAIGANLAAQGEQSTVIGNDVIASSTAIQAVVIGSNFNANPTTSTGAGGVAIGSGLTTALDSPTANGIGSVAIGSSGNGTTNNLNGAVATGNHALALMSGANASATNSIALGTSATANIANSVALGSGSTTTAPSGNSFLTNVAAVPANGVVSVGSATANRRIQNVAGGSAATDAVNVAQLTQQNTLTNKQGTDTAAALGGGSTYTAVTGGVSAPSYSLNNGAVTATNVGAALSNIDGRTMNNTANIATNATNITGLQSQTFRLRTNTDPATAVGSNDTVTFLDGNNVNITRTGNNVTIGTSATPTFTSVTSTGAMTAGSLNTGGALTVTGASNLNGGANLNNNKITGLANGTAVTDAATFGQLSTTNTNVATNTTNIANVQAQANQGFNISADNGIADNVQLSETVNFTNTDGNLVATVSDNGINYDLAENIDLGTAGSIRTGNTVTNNAGVRIDDGTNITAVTATGTNVTDGMNTSNYDANGLRATDGLGRTGNYSAGSMTLNNAGSYNQSTAGSNVISNNTGNANINTATFSGMFDSAGNYNQSTAAENIMSSGTNLTRTSAAGTNVTDGTNSSNYGANGLRATDVNGNSTLVNQTGLSFTNDLGAATGPSITAAGINAGNSTISNVADGVVANDVATFGQLTDTDNIAKGNLAALGGGAAYDAANNIYTAPSYELNNGNNNTDTTLFRNVGDALGNLDGRTTTNTADIANVQAQANKGFNISADNSDLANNETIDNVQLDETINFTNTDGNLVATVSDNGINYDLAENIDLGVNGSIRTGNTITNNTGVRIDDGTNITAVTATGTNVTDGMNTSNYDANGLRATDGFGRTGNYSAGSMILNNAGNYNESTAGSNVISNNTGNANINTATFSGMFDSAGNTNFSTAAENTMSSGTNLTRTSAAGTNITDGTNSSNYGANGLTATDALGNSTLVNQTGLSFTNDLGAATGPSIIAAGINAGNSTISNVADGVVANDVATFGQLTDTDNIAKGNLAALGGGAAYDATNNIYTQPIYTLDDGTNTGTNVTANNVGDALNNLDGRTTTNTSNIANLNTKVDGIDFPIRSSNAQSFTTSAIGIDALAVGSNANANGIGVTAIGEDARANGIYATSIGQNASADSINATAIGQNARADSISATAIGQDARANSINATAIGQNASANSINATSIGVDTTSDINGFAGGQGASAGMNSVALGSQSTANAIDSIAIGSSSSATVIGGVALGQNSVANVAGGATGFIPTAALTADQDAINATNSTNLGAVSVGTGAVGGNRQIVNVAAGTNDSDAVNVSQLKAVDTKVNQGIKFNVDGGERTYALGETIGITTDSNIITSATTDGVNFAINPDLVLDSVTTGNTVTNNAGVRIDDGNGNITAVTAAGTNVTDGISTSNYGANGFTATDGNGNTGRYNAGSTVLTDDSGNTNASAAIGNAILDDSGNVNLSGAIGNAIFDNAGNANLSGAEGSVVFDNAGNRTITSAAGTNVTDGTNTSNYGANGSTIIDGNGNETVIAANGTTVTDGTNTSNYGAEGLTFLDINGNVLANTPSITKTGIDAGSTVITNVANGTVAADSKDAVNGGQLFTTNEAIAAAQAQADLGFNIGADNGTDDNVQLGETINFTNTDGNLVATVSDNGINYDLADDISIDSVTANDGNGNVSTLTATGTNVTDGISTSNYGANGFTATDGNGNTGRYNAGSTVLTDDSGNTNASAAIGNAIFDDSGNVNLSGAIGNAIFDSAGNANLSGAEGSVVFDNAGNRTITSAAGTNVTDGTNTSNYGANGLTATDDLGNSTLVNQTGVSFTDVNGAATGPSITAAGINAGNSTISNVADGVAADDVATFGQLQAANGAADAKTDALGNSTATNLGGGAIYTAATGTVSAPTYTLNDGTNTGTTADFDNVGGALSNLDGRTTTNTSNIANVQAQANRGFNISADNGVADNVQLGETVDFTNTDGNLVATVSNNGINYDLAENIDLGTTGSIRTGNTVTNNAGITILNGPVDTVTLGRNGLNNGGNRVTNVANGIAADDAATFGQVTDVNNKVNTLGDSTAANLGGGATYTAATGTVSAPTYTLDNGANTGTTADFNNVGDALGNLDGRTTANTSDIADLASGKKGLVRQDNGTSVITVGAVTGGTAVDFTNSDGVNRQLTGVASAGDYTVASNANNAVNAGDLNTAVGNIENSVTDKGLTFAGDRGVSVKRKLGETLTITGGEQDTAALANGNNIGVSTNATNDGLLVQLAKNIDLGVDGSVKTGNTVTNNTGIAITDGANITAVTAAGTNVTDGTNTSNYSANGLSINNGPSMTDIGIDSAGNKITNIADATNAGDAVNFGQLQASNNAADVKTDALGNSTATNLGGGAIYTAATGTVSAPTYTLDDGSNTGTNVTANNVGSALDNLNTRTATNTGDIANVQAQANQGFNISAAGGTANNVQLGETVDFTNTDGNLVATASANGINYNLAENIDLGANGSLKTGNTVTNNAGVRVDDGTNITAVTAAGTNVTDGINTSNYGANGFTIVGGPSVTTAGINAGNKVITNLADGVAATDAATKGQVDAVSTGLTDLTAGAVQYQRNLDDTVNYDNVTFAGTQAVIDQDENGNDVVVSGGTRLSNVANGINAADAVNKGQLDSLIAQNVTKVEVNDQNGNPVTVNITDQVVNRNIDNSNMDSSFLTYNVEGQGITDRLTIGETVQKMNTEGVKFAHTNAISAKGDLGITNDSSAGGDNSTAIGVNAIIQEGADSTVALGHNTEASANATNSVVIGKDSQVAGQSSIAIGNGAQALGNQSISIGTGNIVNGNNSGAFGDPSIINGDNSYSVGNNNTINSNDTFVLGNNVTSTVGGSVVLGTGSAARTGAGVAGYLAAGNAAITATTSTTGAVAVGDAANGIYRQVTGVAAGTADSDAVNVSQLKAVSDTLQSNNEALSNAAVQYDKNADGTVNKGSITLGGGAAGTTITNVAAGNVSAGSTDAVNGSQLHNLGSGVASIIGGDAALDASGNLTASNIGGTGKGNISDAIAAVNQGNAQANENIQANKDRLDAGLSFGADSGATISKPIGDTTALKFEGGNNITTTATSSGIKFDLNGNIDVDNITADTVTTGNTTVNNTGVTIKDGPSMTTAGINAGDKTITGVADGIEVNDAVNLGQLTALDNKLSNSVNELGYKINEVEDDANAGISAAMAMSSLPQAYIPGKSMVGGGIATYNGQSAVAIGVSKVSDNGRWVIKVNGTADTQGNAGGAVGAGFHF